MRDTAQSVSVRVQIVDPPAYTPPYDYALCSALARAGVDVELVTSRFSYGEAASSNGFKVSEDFYRLGARQRSSRVRQAIRMAQHVPDMVRYARKARQADLVHFQWLAVQQIDSALLPRRRPLLLTAHDVLPREPRRGQLKGQRRLYDRMDGVIVHSQHGARRLRDEVGVDPDRIHIIPHGAFHELTNYPVDAQLPRELSKPKGPVVLFFGLIRPYKGVDVLLEGWRALVAEGNIDDAELWVVGMPRMDITPLREVAEVNVRWVPRYVEGEELAATFRQADVVVLPYRQIDQSGVLFTALAFNKPVVLTDVGGFPEVAATGAAELFPSGDTNALTQLLSDLLMDDKRRERLSSTARAAAAPGGQYGWDTIAASTLRLYADLLDKK